MRLTHCFLKEKIDKAILILISYNSLGRNSKTKAQKRVSCVIWNHEGISFSKKKKFIAIVIGDSYEF